MGRCNEGAAALALDALCRRGGKGTQKSGKLGLVGFGTFSVVKRKARDAGIRRPQEDQDCREEGCQFKAGKALADKVNK